MAEGAGFENRLARKGHGGSNPSLSGWARSSSLPGVGVVVNPSAIRAHDRRGVRVAEGARLESVCTRKGTAGSNPALSGDGR